MPRYSFECQECCVRFERSLKMGDHAAHACPACGGEAPRFFEGATFGFGFAQGGTGATANSGVHADDYPTADRLVGRDAEKRWEVIKAREKVKEQAREMSGQHALIRHNADDYIDYEPMSEIGVEARRQLAAEAREALGPARETGIEARRRVVQSKLATARAKLKK